MLDLRSSQAGTGRFFSRRNAGLNSFGLITRAVIGEDGHDGVARAELLGKANGAGDIDAG